MLLTLGNPKIEKGTKRGYLTAILHLAPAKLSGFNVCPKATKGCAAACLNTAGRGGIGLDADGLNAIQRARIAKTRRIMNRDTRADFMAELVRDIEAVIRKAERDDLTPVFRLNGTSDLRWETMPVLRGHTFHANIMLAFPDVQFYDYTKLPNRRDLPANYHLTFSLADGNMLDAKLALANGMSVAAVVRDPANPGRRKLNLPATWKGHPVVDGDESDLRFLDPPASWVMLRAKGRAVKDTTGFVHDIEGIAS
jgi:hypothetical protein